MGQKRVIGFGSLRIDSPLQYAHPANTEVRRILPGEPATAGAIGGVPSAASALSGATGGVSSAAGPVSAAVAQQLAALRLQDEHGNQMRYASSKLLDNDRRPVFATAFPECADPGQIYEIIAEGKAQGGSVQVREFTAMCKGAAGTSPPKLLEGSCAITLEDLTPSECVEYCFAEEPDKWRMALLSREALDTYRSTKFQSWLKMLQEPTCEAQLRRMLQIGPVTRMFDPIVFPTPEALKSQYQVIDDKTGRKIDLPHPVSKLRVWDASQQRYEALETLLTGAPPDNVKEIWWQDLLKQLQSLQGNTYIQQLMGKQPAAFPPTAAGSGPGGGIASAPPTGTFNLGGFPDFASQLPPTTPKSNWSIPSAPSGLPTVPGASNWSIPSAPAGLSSGLSSVASSGRTAAANVSAPPSSAASAAGAQKQIVINVS